MEQRATHRELVANNEDTVRLTANSHPVVSFHLIYNSLLKRCPGVFKLFRPHTPEYRVPVKGQGPDTVILVIIEEHRIERDHEKNMTGELCTLYQPTFKGKTSSKTNGEN
jgi:hypothetical protein